jgi:hypothetical protein
MLEQFERIQGLGLGSLVLYVEVDVRSGGVVVLLGLREGEQAADGVEVVGSVAGAMVGGPPERAGGLVRGVHERPGAGSRVGSHDATEPVTVAAYSAPLWA